MYNVKTNTLSCLGKSAIVEPVDGIIKLEILLDRTSLEIFANDGKVAMSSSFTSTEKKADGIFLFNIGGEILVEKLEVYPMKSMYPEK
jgi:sucrose-6-phosphate hydrolase SacC (GH32 family)